MTKGLGIDIVSIVRIRSAVDKFGDKFLNKIYTPDEIQYCKRRKTMKFPELAARFAAKEAYSKAIGTGMRGIHWKNIEILNEKSGKPFLKVRGKKESEIMVSLSHDQVNAIACVIII